MKFHPFNLDYFLKENFFPMNLEDVLKIKEKYRKSKFIPLLYVNCPKTKMKIHVGDCFYDSMKKICYAFTIIKEGTNEYPTKNKSAVKAFGFVLVKKNNAGFLPYNEIINDVKHCAYIGNVFNEKINKDDIPEEMKILGKSLFEVNNLDIFIKIQSNKNVSERKIKIKDLLNLHAAFLKNLNDYHFTIELYSRNNHNVLLQGFSGDLFSIKDNNNLSDVNKIHHFLSNDMSIHLQNKSNKELKLIIDFYREIFISLSLENSIVHYINPNMNTRINNEHIECIDIYNVSSFFERLEYDLKNQIYNQSFLKLL